MTEIWVQIHIPFPCYFLLGWVFFPLYFLFVIYLEAELFKMGKILLYIL